MFSRKINEKRECRSYAAYISRIQDGMIRDLKVAYPEFEIEEQDRPAVDLKESGVEFCESLRMPLHK